jgi:uncharacterized membrane protein AbrB (regulator of aidB expression)
MLSSFKKFVKQKKNDIILFVVVVLLILLSFALGYLTASYNVKEPIRIENSSTYSPDS